MSAGEDNKRVLSTNFQNDVFNIGAAASITIHMGSGTDTATDRYMGLPGGNSYGIEIFPTVACSITKINGLTLKVAASIPVPGYKAQYGKFSSFEITASAATVIEIGGKC